MPASVPAGPLRTGTLLRLFIPLALSDMIMILSGPIIGAVLARLAEPRVHLAAYSAAMSIAILIESPIIMVLHAATAMAGNPAAYRTLHRLVWIMNAMLTAVFATMAFTPAYYWVFDTVLGMPPAVVAAARPALGAMLLWPAAIGWRRYHQGFLIHARRSSLVGWGGLTRLGALVTGVVTAAALGLPGALCAAIGLQASVLAEGGTIHLFAARERRRLAAAPPEPGDDDESLPRGMAALTAWYLPLAATQVLVWLVRPATNAGIARAGLVEMSLAVWPVAWSTVGLMGNGARAVQQLAITLVRDHRSYAVMQRFVLGTGATFSALLSLIAFTPLGRLYLTGAIGLTPDLAELAMPALQVALLYPGLVALENWYQALLIRSGRTRMVNLGALVAGVATLAALFAGALGWRLPGAPLAAAATVLGIMVELLVLQRATAGERERWLLTGRG